MMLRSLTTRPFANLLRVGIALVALVGVVACSSSTTGGSGGAGTCGDYIAALREGAQRCGRYIVAPGREAELAARLEKQCATSINAPGNGITPAVLASCAEKARAACGDDDACEDIEIKGSLPDGAACGTDTQCAGGDCKIESSGSSGNLELNRCGKCVSRVALGGACGGTNPGCAQGLTCESKADGPGTCVERKRLAEGEICFDPAKPSSAPTSCAEGLACKIESGGSGTSTGPVKCTRRAGAGAACTSESDCVSELVCVNNACGSPGPEGTTCTSSGQCATGACSQTTKKCVAIQWVAAGGTCDSNNEKRCIRGHCSVISSSGTITPTGKCIDPIPDGAACKNSGLSDEPQCDRYASCVAGTCQIFDPASCK